MSAGSRELSDQGESYYKKHEGASWGHPVRNESVCHVSIPYLNKRYVILLRIPFVAYEKLVWAYNFILNLITKNTC